MHEPLILVDQFGDRIGVADRDLCHQGDGIRHRAFVVFIIADDGRHLVQKRACCKLGGDRWDVSATSHVRVDESYQAAIRRCLAHELGITAPVRPRYRLAYNYQQTLDAGAENEHCSLFLVDYSGNMVINRREIDEIRWVGVTDLNEWFETGEHQFTRWFAEAFRRMCTARSTMPS